MGSNHRFSCSENFQTDITTNPVSQSNLAESSTASHHLSSQHYGNPETYATMVQFSQSQQTMFRLASPITQSNFDVNSPIQPVHPNTFFYKPPNDPCNYHVECKEIPFDLVIQLLNKFNGNVASNINLNQNEHIF